MFQPFYKRQIYMDSSDSLSHFLNQAQEQNIKVVLGKKIEWYEELGQPRLGFIREHCVRITQNETIPIGFILHQGGFHLRAASHMHL